MSDITLSGLELITLKGQNIPNMIDVNFNCAYNKLTSLEFGPKEIGNFYWCDNNKLTSLEFCATKIGTCLYAYGNSISNLKDIHKQFKNGHIGLNVNLSKNPIKSHTLGIILIPRLQSIFINDFQLQQILNRHLITKDILECQEELIQNGFKEFAQL